MKNLKKIRNEKNITQIRLSIAAEISQETISAYESGKAFPSVETLIKIANFLDEYYDTYTGLYLHTKSLLKNINKIS